MNQDLLSRIQYMKSAKNWLILSVVLTLLAALALSTLGLNTGIDFNGGTTYDITYEGDVSQGTVSDAVTHVVGNAGAVQKTETKGAETSGFLVTVPELTAEKKEALLAGLEGAGPSFTLVGEDNVSGSVSSELTKKAFLAIAIASVLQILYIWIRFDLKFGVTAVVGLLHDVVITLGLVSVLRIPINSPFVAAILTILGYSINDSVVVIDRIRENLKQRGKNESTRDVVTRSIQEVIHRSLYTVLTTLLALLALILLGGHSIRDFVFTLFIGITLGAYSSIFICSALWVYWTEYQEKHGRPAKSKGAQKGKLKPSKA